MSNYSWGLPIAASTYAKKIDHSFWILHVVMIGLFVGWGIYMAYCMVRYRQKKGVAAHYTHHIPWKSYIPDVAMFLFEVWLIFIVGVPIWAHIKEDLPKPENATVINIRAEQFTWLAHYPGPDGIFGKQDIKKSNADNPLGLDETDPNGKDDIIAVDALYIPLGKPVLVNLTAKDVIHSFFIPEFRIKQDAVPGMKIPIWFEPNQTGTFELVCAQLCGAGHYRMRADVFVKTPEQFDAWVQEQEQAKTAAAASSNAAAATAEVW